MIQSDLQKAIDKDALMGKSKVYVRRALRCKIGGDHDQYQLWASLALELLGKAVLSGIHPSLVVDPTHYKSLFAASGINISTDIKTISAHTVFERLSHLLPAFDESVKNFCEALSRRRNAELHSGEVPFHNMKLDGWERWYWHACQLVLGMSGSSLDEWLGADATAPKEIVEQAKEAIRDAVRIRIEQCAELFGKLSKSAKENARSAAVANAERNHALMSLEDPDAWWETDCPACGSQGIMAGMQYGEQIIEYDSEKAADPFSLWGTVEREYIGEELRCAACQLHLTGKAEVDAAGLESTHWEYEEQEIQFEPDYGNE